MMCDATRCSGVERSDKSKDEPALAGPCGALGPRNAVPGTVSENSLNQHGHAGILGISRRRPQSLSAPSSLLEMTDLDYAPRATPLQELL